ncbi:MAG TPA: DUF2600 family protein [Conexibacter sp.]|nr:DUF2600 family protein [Conexibacter sp.]
MLAMLRTLKALSDYQASILPRARREINRWANVAAAIPDPTLRKYAMDGILLERTNPQAVAALAATAPRRQRRSTIELLVAYQVLLDYLDTAGEQLCADELHRGVAFGMALAAAVSPPGSPIQLDPVGNDGGYLSALVTACRARLWQLPSAAVIAREAEIAAVRCAQGLAHTHTATWHGTNTELRRWTGTQFGTNGYSWWEIAAGTNSNLAVLALLAAAADAKTTHQDALAIASAYWPHVCVLSTLYDSLVDFERDEMTGDFSFISHYPSNAALRFGLIRARRRSLTASTPLRRGHIHKMIICGVAGYYVAFPTRGSLAAQLAPSLLAELDPAGKLIILVLRAQHRVQSARRVSNKLRPTSRAG